MEYRKLGSTGVEVSTLCLGTMTWGEQNTREDAFEQMDYAVDYGVNFFDTAELYSIPPKASTYGETERIIGEWFKSRKQRSKIILASKIAGPGEGWIDHIRQGKTQFNDQYIAAALNDSLQRLQTDYIDLYQLHWPERHTNFFGPLGYTPVDDKFTPVKETLLALEKQVKAGKIRYIGLSNETPWGAAEFIHTAREFNLPLIASIQNPYSLLNRSYEVGMAEISWREKCGLLAYSPLGFGVLSGKYLHNHLPENARLTLFPDYARYSNPVAIRATQQYVELARQHRLEPAQMALAFVNSRPFLTSTIIGATTMEQLVQNIGSIDLKLSVEVLEGIEAIHQEISNPCP